MVLAVLSMLAALARVVGAISVLVRERLPLAIGEFLELLLRYQFRLIAYHLSLVERYPSTGQATVSHAPNSV